MPKVVVVGAGISGLAIAYHLQQSSPPIDVTVLERASRPGGKLWTERQHGFQVELGANGFLNNKASTLGLCRDLGLTDRLVRADPEAAGNRFLAFDDALIRVPKNALEFLRSGLLSWGGKLRLLAEPFQRSPRLRTDESVRNFVVRRAGQEAADVFADALVTGIYAGDPSLLSLSATLPRLHDYEQKYGSILKGAIRSMAQRASRRSLHGAPAGPRDLLSFREGLRSLVEALAGRLERRLVLGAEISEIRKGKPEDGRTEWILRGMGRESWCADAVILACPAAEQAGLLNHLDAPLADLVAQIPYNSVAVVALGYDRRSVPQPLNGFGFIVPQRSRRDVLGVQWCSSLFPERAPGDCVLLRAMCGGWHRPEIVHWDDGRLLSAVQTELGRLMGITAPPRFHTIVRWHRAIPQYHVGHEQRVRSIEKRSAAWPGLFLAGNAYHGVAINDCTEQAAIIAGKARQYMQPPGSHR